MDAKSLYDIVKDVDREAWPEGMYFSTGTQTWWIGDPSKLEHAPQVAVGYAELLFIGSMVKHVIKRGMFLIESAERFAVVKDVRHATIWYRTPVEALAAACKAVRKDHP